MNTFYELFGLLLTSYGAGVLTSFTPCVYPMIPITLSAFSGRSSAQHARGDLAGPSGKPDKPRFVMAVLFALGISLTYTALGLLAAWGGSLFGSFLGYWPVSLAIAAILCALALAELDCLNIPGLAWLQTKASHIGGKSSPMGIFLLGAASGFVAAPCVGPALVGILTLAARESLLTGGLLLFVYGLGLSSIFLVLALFSDSLLRLLPKSGPWMRAVKILLAAILFALAFLFLSYGFPSLAQSLPSLPWWPDFAMLAFALCSLGLLVFASPKFPGKTILLALAGTTLFLLAPFFQQVQPLSKSSILQNASSKPGEAKNNLHWWETPEQAFAHARAHHLPLLIDFYADWCAACKELEQKTFPDPVVSKELQRFSLLRIDMTQPDDATLAFAEQYEVMGLPAIRFTNAQGREMKSFRIHEFLPPEAFLKKLPSHSSEILK